MTKPISFYDRAMHLVDEGSAVDVIYLDFSEKFAIVLLYLVEGLVSSSLTVLVFASFALSAIIL